MISGLEVLDKFERLPTGKKHRPIEPPSIQSVTIHGGEAVRGGKDSDSCGVIMPPPPPSFSPSFLHLSSQLIRLPSRSSSRKDYNVEHTLALKMPGMEVHDQPEGRATFPFSESLGGEPRMRIASLSMGKQNWQEALPAYSIGDG